MIPFQLERGRETFVGEVHVTVEVENAFDREFARRGQMREDEVRRETVEMLVDTGAYTLVMPEDVIDRLGLRRLRTVQVTYADDRKADLWEAGLVSLAVMGRTAEVSCVVAERGTEPLLGRIPLDVLDLLVDCPGRRLVPNPVSPDRPHRKIE